MRYGSCRPFSKWATGAAAMALAFLTTGTLPAPKPLAASPGCVTRCITTALWWNSFPPAYQLLCINSCTAGCVSFTTTVPGYGEGESCKCSGTGGPYCCYLIAGYNNNYDPPHVFFATGGVCGSASCDDGTCTIWTEGAEEPYEVHAECTTP